MITTGEVLILEEVVAVTIATKQVKPRQCAMNTHIKISQGCLFWRFPQESINIWARIYDSGRSIIGALEKFTIRFESGRGHL